MAKGNGGTRVGSATGYRKSGLTKSAYETMLHGHLSNIDIDGTNEKVLDIGGRKIVMMDFGGTKVPFYLSTGKGGKADVPAGRWYPFFGFSEEGIKGWFIKGEGIGRYYDDERLMAAGHYLDKKFGDRRDREDWGKKIRPNSQEHRDAMRAINKVVNPNNYGLRQFYSNPKEIDRLLVEPIKKKIKLR